ncbi:TPA: hypothetical protein ACM5WY_002168, partial [Neisseria gonorrhoeae]
SVPTGPDSRLRGNDGSGIPIVSPGGRGEMRNGQGGAERAVLCPGFPFSREHISPPAAFALEIV